ncbi:MAG: T9SS type A sorting domain-containing protein [Candidatus Hatepunaea meridiana]|nr:T9SS type A sorting domain-containing protein [Candidatus Hatepunaea meridiana]
MIRNFTILLILICNIVYAQPQVIWHRIFSGRWCDRCLEVIQTPDNGYALAGERGYGVSPNIKTDFYLVRTNENGDSLWSRHYGGNDGENCSAILQTEDGDFLLAGKTESYGADFSDGWIVKTDSEGDVVWSRTYGRDSEFFSSIIPITDNRYALIGMGGAWNYYFVIIDEDGEELFADEYGGRGAEFGRSLVQTPDEGFLLAGSSTSFGEGGYDMYLIKIDEEGEIEWTQTYGGEANDYCQSIIRTIDGGYALAGGTRSYGAGEVDFYLVKIDEDGEEQWSSTYGRRYDDLCFSMLQLENGDFVLAGYSNRRDEGNGDDFYIIRVDSCGELIWEQNFNSGRLINEVCYSLIQTSDGGYALAGKSNLIVGNSYDFYLVKLGTDMIAWLPLPDSSFIEGDSLIYDIEYFYDYFIPTAYQDSVLAFSVDDGEHIYGVFEEERLIITAEENWFGVDSLMLTIAEADSEDNCDSAWLHLTVEENKDVNDVTNYPLPLSFTLHNAFPNPFNSQTRIAYNLPQAGLVTLNVYDITGRQVTTLVDGVMNGGRYSVVWDGGCLMSGLYLVRMKTPEGVWMTKMALVK